MLFLKCILQQPFSIYFNGLNWWFWYGKLFMLPANKICKNHYGFCKIFLKICSVSDALSIKYQLIYLWCLGSNPGDVWCIKNGKQLIYFEVLWNFNLEIKLTIILKTIPYNGDLKYLFNSLSLRLDLSYYI